MDEELWDLMTDRDKLNAYECACQDLAKANARLAEAEHRLALSVDDIAHGATEAVKWEKRARKAELERDEARHEVEVRDHIYSEAAKSFVKLASAQIEIERLNRTQEATDLALIDEIRKHNRDRRTIRALVVAFRITWYCVNNEYPRARETIKRLLAERGQAREAKNG